MLYIIMHELQGSLTGIDFHIDASASHCTSCFVWYFPSQHNSELNLSVWKRGEDKCDIHHTVLLLFEKFIRFGIVYIET